MHGENNLTSEFDENHKVLIGPDTSAAKRVSSNNILTRSLSKRGADDDVDFEGATNPSVHKGNPNDILGGFEEINFPNEKPIFNKN